MSRGVLFDYAARILSVHGHVEEGEFNILADQLLRLDTEAAKPITIYFSARGGNLVDALKILDVFGTLRSPTIGIAMGLCEGASVVVFAAARTRIMMPSAILSPARLWDLPGPHERSGLHSSTTVSIRTHLHQRLREMSSQLPHVVELILESEKQPRLITASEAMRLRLTDQVLGAKEIKSKAQTIHVR
jgi:ATP-dependent protease ClpP protease subunit